MSKDVVILFGTESGNAEFAAEDIASKLEGHRFEVVDMTDFEVSDFSQEKLYLVICSTHGEGDLPSGAVPLMVALEVETPDLAGIEYGVFGLGNSTYENYSQGSNIIDRMLGSLGATRVGEFGRHDANSGTLPNDFAVSWAAQLLAKYID